MSNSVLAIATRFALYANLMVLFGWPLLALSGTPNGINGPSPQRLALLVMATAGLSIAGLVAMTASMLGVAVVEVDRASVAAMVLETPMGLAWQARMAALAIILALAAARGQAARIASVGLAAAALATLAWTGHGAAGEATTGWLQLAADVVHLLAAGAWVGALVGLGLMVSRDASQLTSADFAAMHRALNGFASVGSLLVALLIVTGLINTWILVGPQGVTLLPNNRYVQLLTIKLAVFACMLGLAVINRFRLTPAMSRALDAGTVPLTAVKALRRSISIEVSLAAAVLAIVAWLGTLMPPEAA